MSNETPVIVDDWYWLRRAAEILSDSAKKLDDGARAIAAAMAWFWTVYSGAMVAVLALSNRGFTWQWGLFLAAPGVLLFVAYSVATWASLPIPIAFNVIAPQEIKDAHEAWIDKKLRRLSISLGLGALAALLVAAVVIALSLSNQGRKDGIAFRAADGADGPEVLVGGRMAVDTDLLIQITAPGQPPASRLFAAAKGQDFTIAVPVAVAPAYNAQMSWTADGRTTTIREEVKRP